MKQAKTLFYKALTIANQMNALASARYHNFVREDTVVKYGQSSSSGYKPSYGFGSSVFRNIFKQLCDNTKHLDPNVSSLLMIAPYIESFLNDLKSAQTVIEQDRKNLDNLLKERLDSSDVVYVDKIKLQLDYTSSTANRFIDLLNNWVQEVKCFHDSNPDSMYMPINELEDNIVGSVRPSAPSDLSIFATSSPIASGGVNAAENAQNSKP